MLRTTLALAALLLSFAPAVAQSNTVPGLDGRLYDIDSPTVWGRRGPAYPGGEIGFSVSNTMCNPGSVAIPWAQAMAENHPKFGFMVARVAGDRIEQVSDRSFCKHAFLSVNSPGGPCGPCQNTNAGSQMYVGCSDAYGAGNNGDRYWLGPADEIDPWLGTWTAVGSYFDRGDPEVAAPNNTDGQRSLSFGQVAAMDVVKNRVTMAEQDLLTANADYYYMVHLVHEGEAVQNRGDNLLTRPVTFSWSGAQWSASNGGPVQSGSILNRWPGATVTMAGNGTADGRIAIAVKTTDLGNGMWHYEYAVHNVDNSRGAASFRLPMCTRARVENIAFRDIDGNALNQWTAAIQGGEIAFTAPSSNPLDWNMLFNFSFDSDAAPIAGVATFDEARVGPGALQFTVPTQVPGEVHNVWLGDGCGTPAVQVSANGTATIPAPNLAIVLEAPPFSAMLLFFSLGQANLPLAPGCNQFIDGNSIGTAGFFLTGASGVQNVPFPIPAGIQPASVFFQAASLINGGPVFGSFGLSNGLEVRVGATGCP